MTRRRLDSELVRRGLASTAAEAEAAVLSGLVSVGGVRATKAGTLVADDAPVRLAQVRENGYVSRGGVKLAAALDRFDVDPSGRACLDAGASTGGFTDCLLQRGAAHVVAVDVGYGQLDWRLRTDPRVQVRERTNVRDLRPEEFEPPPALVVADLSFVSLRSVLGSLVRVAGVPATLVLLVKPQFEAASADVGPGGVVSDPRAWRGSLQGVAEVVRARGFDGIGVMASPLLGPAGNVEFLLACRRPGPGVALDLDLALSEGQGLL